VTERVLGFRTWKLEAGRLGSWTVDYRWEPGENRARCLTPRRSACATPPGRHCRCGFWAAWSPRRCVGRGSAETDPPCCVMGLISGWGAVARHHADGFRAEFAAPMCLFVDRPWSVFEPVQRGGVGGWWARTTGRGIGPLPVLEPPDDDPELQDGLLEAAARYAIPLVPIEAAANAGLLAELGVSPAQVQEAIRSR